MIVQLFNEIGQDEPTHEFTTIDPPGTTDILRYEPTGEYYIYFNRSKGVLRYRKSQVVSINLRVGG